MKNTSFLALLTLGLLIAAASSAITWNIADKAGNARRLEDFKNGLAVGCNSAPGALDPAERSRICRDMVNGSHG